MEGGAIVLFHCILFIRAMTFFDEYLYCTIYIVHWRGSTSRIKTSVFV